MSNNPHRILPLFLGIMFGIISILMLLFSLNNTNDVLASPTGVDVCFTSLDNTNTTFASTGDASAIQAAVDAVADDGLIKVAGTCEGTFARSGLTQTVYISKSLTLQGGYNESDWSQPPAPNANPTILDAQSGGRVAVVTGTYEVTLNGLELTGGFVPTNSLTGDGGGIYHYDGILTIENSVLKNNVAGGYGGGLYHLNGNMTVANTLIISNTANSQGGGIQIREGQIILSNSRIQENKAGSSGGGITVRRSGVITINNSLIMSNTSNNQGGGFENNGRVQINGSTFSHNVAGERGGGISSSGTSFQVYNSTISSNQVLTSTDSDGAWENGGGGIFLHHGNIMTLTHSTVASNTTPSLNGKDGILISDGTLNLRNTLIAYNGRGLSGAANCQLMNESTINSNGYNISSDSSCTTLTTTGDLTNTNPILGLLADNGSEMPTHTPMPGSPAIDAIPETISGCGDIYITDQRGFIRPFDGNFDNTNGCDIGAHEVGNLIHLPIILKQ